MDGETLKLIEQAEREFDKAFPDGDWTATAAKVPALIREIKILDSQLQKWIGLSEAQTRCIESLGSKLKQAREGD